MTSDHPAGPPDGQPQHRDAEHRDPERSGAERSGAERSGAEGARVEAHDPSGLGLARSIARSAGKPRRRRRPSDSSRTEPQSSGPRPDDRDPKLLGDALDRLVDSKGWGTEISVHTLLGRWPVLVGPELGAHSTPESYADTVLTVRTDSTAWASQVRLLAPNLIATLNRQLGDGTVTRVKVLGPDAPSWKKGLRSVRDGRGPRDTYG